MESRNRADGLRLKETFAGSPETPFGKALPDLQSFLDSMQEKGLIAGYGVGENISVTMPGSSVPIYALSLTVAEHMTASPRFSMTVRTIAGPETTIRDTPFTTAAEKKTCLEMLEKTFGSYKADVAPGLRAFSV